MKRYFDMYECARETISLVKLFSDKTAKSCKNDLVKYIFIMR